MLCLCDLHTKKCVFFSTISPAIRFCTCLPRESRFSLPHTQSFAAARKIACRIRTYSAVHYVIWRDFFVQIELGVEIANLGGE